MKDTSKNLTSNFGKLLVLLVCFGMFACANEPTAVNAQQKEDGANQVRTDLLAHATPNQTSFAKAELNEEPSPIKVNIPAANDQILVKAMKTFNATLGFEEFNGHFRLNTAQGAFQCQNDRIRMNMWKLDKPMLAVKEAAANGNLNALMELNKTGFVMDMRWVALTGGVKKTEKKLGADKEYQVVTKGGTNKTVSHYQDLTYGKVYDNIDVRYTRMENGALAYDMVAYDAVNIAEARFMLDGADNVSIATDGSLLINTPIGEMRQTAPLAYQMINGEKVNVDVDFVVNADNSVGFKIGEHQAAKPVVIGTIVFDWSAVATGDRAYGLGLSPHPQGGKMLMGAQSIPNMPEKVGTYKAAANEGYTNFLAQLTKGGDIESITYFATR